MALYHWRPPTPMLRLRKDILRQHSTNIEKLVNYQLIMSGKSKLVLKKHIFTEKPNKAAYKN
jgi:hypothetical protein